MSVGTGASLLSLLVGCGLLIWRRRFATLTLRFQNQTWGFHLGARDERIGVFVTTVVGLGFLAVGVLGLLGFLHWKPGTF
jgi:hypothetical protein